MARKRPLSAFLGFLAISVLMGVEITRVGLAADAKVQTDKDKDKKVPLLFVQTAKGATLANGKLTLNGVSPMTVFFSDRPTRVAGHVATSEMIPLWSEGKDSFLKDPPNATLSTFTADGKVGNVVVELKNPGLKGDQMTYDVRVLEGKLPDKAEGASLFIDVIGMPLTPLSYAGAARRAARRVRHPSLTGARGPLIDTVAAGGLGGGRFRSMIQGCPSACWPARRLSSSFVTRRMTVSTFRAAGRASPCASRFAG